MRFKRFSMLCAMGLALASGPACHGQASGIANLPVVRPVINCSALASAEISTSVGSPTHITSASEVASGKPAPYCDVQGYVDPQVKFEVRLPLSNWTQRYVQTGCGGLCGMLGIRLGNDDGCLPAQNGELALASTDMGHSGGMDGKFGEKDYQLRIDFAYRGVHVTALAAKALMEKYYGQQARYSYFTGCSDGGREALMEAQRYPQDFNGITAGAPAMNFTTQNTFYHGWNARMNAATDGRPILTADQLPILHKAALAQCDQADGLQDGLISNPVACHFDPAVTQCKPGQDPASCLTTAQVKTAQEIYAGAHDSEGNKFVLGGPLPGSELAWEGVFVPRQGEDRTLSSMISTGTLKYLAYEKNPTANYTLADFKFDQASFAETARLHSLYDATNPDLSAFSSAGGKLILWHGMADPHISPLNTIAYYTAMQQLLGKPAVERFARLYLFPGGYHCDGGEGPFHVDLLSPIMAWVENGLAPGALIASHVPGNGVQSPPPPSAAGTGPPMGPPPNMGTSPSATAKPDRTRPVFPYPLTARYSGSGSVNDARNFVPGSAEPAPASALNWMGLSFYSARVQQWCTASGSNMTCAPKR